MATQPTSHGGNDSPGSLGPQANTFSVLFAFLLFLKHPVPLQHILRV